MDGQTGERGREGCVSDEGRRGRKREREGRLELRDEGKEEGS